MISGQAPKDLIVLSADMQMRLATERLLARSRHLGFRPISSDVLVHPERDPGVLRQSHVFLRTHIRRYRHAIAMCDREGCGSRSSREELEAQVEQQLRINGWDDRASAIVIDPELETWMWGNWTALQDCVGWRVGSISLREWLIDQKLLDDTETKPAHPKETLERVLRQTRKPRSGALFASMGEKVDTSGCVDEAFLKLKSTLQRWFPK